VVGAHAVHFLRPYGQQATLFAVTTASAARRPGFLFLDHVAADWAAAPDATDGPDALLERRLAEFNTAASEQDLPNPTERFFPHRNTATFRYDTLGGAVDRSDELRAHASAVAASTAASSHRTRCPLPLLVLLLLLALLLGLAGTALLARRPAA